MRFSVRDLLWLTTVICLALGWVLWIRSLPPPDPSVKGRVLCDGQSMVDSRIYFHSTSGPIYGSTIVEGRFGIPRLPPEDDYKVSIEGDGIPAKYGLGSPLRVSIRRGRNEFSFELVGQ